MRDSRMESMHMHPSKDIQAEGLSLSAGKMSEETNFLFCPCPESLEPLSALEKSVHQVLAELQKYVSVIERRESLALNLGMPLRGSILCDQLSKLFTVPRPSTVDGPEVSWAKVVLTLGPSPEHFDPNPICKIGDSSIELAEEDYLLISSGRPWRFLSPWPDRKDCELELGVTNTSLEHVANLEKVMAAVLQARQSLERLLLSRRESLACTGNERLHLMDSEQAVRTESTEPTLPPQKISIQSVVNCSEADKVRLCTFAETSCHGAHTSAVSPATPASGVDRGGLGGHPPLSYDMQPEKCISHAAAFERSGPGEKQIPSEGEEQNARQTAGAASPRPLPTKIVTLGYSRGHFISDNGSVGGSIVDGSVPSEESRSFIPNINKNSLRPSSTTHTNVSFQDFEAATPSFSGQQKTDGDLMEPRSGSTVPHKRGPRVKYIGRKRRRDAEG